MSSKHSARRGRPPSPDGRVPLNLSVPPYVKTWLKRHAKNASATVRKLVNAAIAAQKKRVHP